MESKINYLEVGEVITGKVRGIKPYGAFINMGGVTGLLPVSEISHTLIDNPHILFNVNDEVKVRIIEVEVERGRVLVSIKQLDDPPALSSDKKPKAPSDGSGGFEARTEVEGQAYSAVP